MYYPEKKSFETFTHSRGSIASSRVIHFPRINQTAHQVSAPSCDIAHPAQEELCNIRQILPPARIRRNGVVLTLHCAVKSSSQCDRCIFIPFLYKDDVSIDVHQPCSQPEERENLFIKSQIWNGIQVCITQKIVLRR